MARRDDDSLADQVAAALTIDDPDLIRRVEMMERLAAGRVAHVAANGKFPKWSLERWMAIVTTALVTAGSVLAWTFVAGGQWRHTQASLEEVKQEMRMMRESQGTLQQRIWELQQEIQRIERVDEYYRTNPPRPPRTGGSR